jgi:hypothetical protein
MEGRFCTVVIGVTVDCVGLHIEETRGRTLVCTVPSPNREKEKLKIIYYSRMVSLRQQINMIV